MYISATRGYNIIYTLYMLKMVDPVTNMVEIVQVKNTKCDKTRRAFEDTWLVCYPLPKKVLTDGGPEFSSHKWDFMLDDWGLKCARISLHTRMANSIIQFSHQSMGQILQTIFENEKLMDKEGIDKVVRAALACTMQALQSTTSTSLNGTAPGVVVFSRDMVFNIPIVTNIISIWRTGSCRPIYSWNERIDNALSMNIRLVERFMFIAIFQELTSSSWCGKVLSLFFEFIPIELLLFREDRFMNECQFDIISLIKFDVTFPSQWSGMGTSCIAGQVLVLDRIDVWFTGSHPLCGRVQHAPRRDTCVTY